MSSNDMRAQPTGSSPDTTKTGVDISFSVEERRLTFEPCSPREHAYTSGWRAHVGGFGDWEPAFAEWVKARFWRTKYRQDEGVRRCFRRGFEDADRAARAGRVQ